MKRWLTWIGIAGIAAAAVTLPATVRLTAEADLSAYDLDTLTAPDRGIVQFTFGDWGGLSADTLRTNAVPWKLAEAALALRAAEGDIALAQTLDAADIFRPFGFHVPSHVANWPDTVPAPRTGALLGLVRGQSGGATPLSVEIGNIGCAACHSAITYSADGTPNPDRVWLGGTNASLNLAGYTDALFAALKEADLDALLTVARARFPSLSWREAATLRHIIWPALQKELDNRDQLYAGLLPFLPSHIGATNGYDSLRLQLGLLDDTTPVGASYFTSIPALGDRTWRSRFLANGVYAMPGIEAQATTTSATLDTAQRDGMARVVSYFLLPSMGVSEAVAIDQHTRARDVVRWLETYTPQPYPAPINTVLAARGRDVYHANCAACHGTYDTSLTQPNLTSFPNWGGDVGTHPGPPLAQMRQIADAVSASPYAPYLDVQVSPNRSAPPLTGLWASAPYLANGSVPTLWHLMRPDQRPDSFPIGGHRLDMARVGLDLTPPSNHQPWAETAIFDTTREGASNVGHTIGFDGLSEAQKTALLEYLKLL